MKRTPDISGNDDATIANKLGASRRVLVTGLRSVSADVMVSACNLAEALGAAIDAGDGEMARPAGPTIARAGEVTADREELRDRADFVIFWFCDPHAGDPGFIERFVTPFPVSSRPRRTMAIGPHAIPGIDIHVQLPRTAAIDAARILRHILVHGREAAGGEPFAEPCTTIAETIGQATCVAIVSDHADDPLGLEPWSVVHLVRTIAHRKPAFEIPLTGGDSTLAATILTWRYGAAGAIAKADRTGGRFLPGEASAVQLIERDEIDCVVAVGRLSPTVAAALEARRGAVAVITLDDPDPVHARARLESIVSSVRGATADTGVVDA